MVADIVAEDSDPPKPAKPRARWRRRFLWLGLVLIVGALWLNGPGFRWLGSIGMQKALEKFEFEGEFVLKGRLSSGPSLHDIRLRGPGKTEIEGSELSLRYAPMKLIGGGVTAVVKSLALRDLRGTVDLPALQEALAAEPEPVPEETEPSEPFRYPWSELPQPQIELQNVDVTVLLPEEETLVIEGFDLATSGAGGSAGHLRWESVKIPGGREFGPVDGGLGYADGDVVLENWQPLPVLAVRRLGVSITDQQELRLDAALGVDQGEFALAFVLGKEAKLSLEEGAIRFAEAAADWLPEDMEIGGQLDALTLGIEGMDGPWQAWRVTADLGLAGMAYETYSVQGLQVGLEQSGSGIALELSVDLDAENRLHANASLPPFTEELEWETQPWEAELSVDASKLDQWLARRELPEVVKESKGEFKVTGTGSMVDQVNGQFRVGAIDVAPWKVPGLQIDISPVAGSNGAQQIVLRTEEELLEGTFSVDPRAKTYEGSLSVNASSLARLQPTAPEEEQLIGAVELKWDGSGGFTATDHEGQMVLQSRNVGPATAGLLYQADMKLGYQGTVIMLETLDWAQGDLGFHAEGSLSTEQIELAKIQLAHGETQWLEGHVRIPLATEVESMRDRLWAATEPVDVRLQSIPIPLQTVMTLAGQDRECTGELELSVQAGGLMNALAGDLRFEGRQLGLKMESPIPAVADLNLGVEVGGGRVKAQGSLKHPDLAAWIIDAEVPFDLREPEEVAEAAIAGRLQIPSTDLAFLGDLLPALRKIQGSLAADVTVDGSVEEPNVNGQILLNAPLVRFTNRDLPTIEDATVDVEATMDEVRLNEISTRLAGGTVNVGGAINLSGEQPVFDVDVTARQALLTRNENMVVRANADLALDGPLDSAALQGSVGLVQSRFFKEIELIPTTRPATSLPQSSVSIPQNIKIESKPLADWRFNVRVHTAETFRVRTTLAAADVDFDLRVDGTGALISPVGQVTLTDAYARLPFSRLGLKNSAIRFTPESGIPGVLDIRGESLVRDYRARIRVTGSMNDVKYVLTSDPPLPEEEIMTLLATGTTREELVGGTNAAASRAALLLFDKFWRMISGSDDWKDPEAMREQRVTFEAGQVNPRTGSTVTTARLRMTDKWSITADADMDGEYRGLLHYVFRF